MALETFNLRQQLQQTRQELSTALYQNDAAVRVIARLTRERDEARDVLAKINVHDPSATNGDTMQVDAPGLPDELVSRVESTQERCVLDFSKSKPPLYLSGVLGFQKRDGSALYPRSGRQTRALGP